MLRLERISRMTLAALALLANSCLAIDVDLTRFGPARYVPDIESPNVAREAFFGVPGDARLLVTLDASARPQGVRIGLNGKEVWSLDAAGKVGSFEVPVRLAETNALRVELTGLDGAPVTVRVKQRADVDLSLSGRIHFNVNTNDYAATREFYRHLGFVRGLGPFPETNILPVSHGVGILKPYRMYAEIVCLGEPGNSFDNLLIPTGRFIDMIEWKDPRTEAPAYPNINHPGIARLTLASSDLDADVRNMKAHGAPFLSEPVRRADGARFAIMRDPSGIFVELREEPGAQPVEYEGSHVTEVRQLTINVHDFERSRAFYRMLGFERGDALPETESAEVARAMGLDAPYRVRAELMRHRGDGSRIELVEWLAPRDGAPPYPRPIIHPGMQRINYAVDDLVGDIAKLKAQGVRFLSDIAACCEGDQSRMGFIAFYDPDGNFIQMMGAIEPGVKTP